MNEFKFDNAIKSFSFIKNEVGNSMVSLDINFLPTFYLILIYYYLDRDELEEEINNFKKIKVKWNNNNYRYLIDVINDIKNDNKYELHNKLDILKNNSSSKELIKKLPKIYARGIESMLNHKIIISSSIIIFIGILISYIVRYNRNEVRISIGIIYLTTCIITYPAGLYTCYRSVYKEENDKNDSVSKLMNSIYDLGAILFVPLFLSPFVLKKYIGFLVKDYKE